MSTRSPEARTLCRQNSLRNCSLDLVVSDVLTTAHWPRICWQTISICGKPQSYGEAQLLQAITDVIGTGATAETSLTSAAGAASMSASSKTRSIALRVDVRGLVELVISRHPSCSGP